MSEKEAMFDRKTDEALAEEYAVENWEFYEEGQTDYKALKEAYLAGHKAGRASQWHDLRKNPDDLPKLDDKDMSDYVITDMGVGYYNGRVKSWFILNECSLTDCVIAWCEKPKFEEAGK